MGQEQPSGSTIIRGGKSRARLERVGDVSVLTGRPKRSASGDEAADVREIGRWVAITEWFHCAVRARLVTSANNVLTNGARRVGHGPADGGTGCRRQTPA
jgi:hypothetical protein